MTATTTEVNKRTVRRLPEEVANQGNFDVLDEIFADDFIDHTPLGELRGRDAAKEQFEQTLPAFPACTVTVEDIIAEGDTVAIRVTWQATHDGEHVGIESTGQAVEFSVTEFHRLEGGKTAERWFNPINSVSYNNSASSNRPENNTTRQRAQ